MPEFLLRYKTPEDADTDLEIEKVRLQTIEMAEEVQTLVSGLFFGMEVAFEVREFSPDTSNQPDFNITGWVTDNDDRFVELVDLTQSAVLERMQQLAYKNQSVGCWWQRVEGKWGEASGLKTRDDGDAYSQC